MPASDIGIDLGTRNCLVYSTAKGLVLQEPSVVVYDKNTEKIRAIGEEARQMAGHVTSNMEVIRPIRQGVIADFNVTEKMLKYFITKAMGNRVFRKPRISICVPRADSRSHRLRCGCNQAFWKSDRRHRRRNHGCGSDLSGRRGGFCIC